MTTNRLSTATHLNRNGRDTDRFTGTMRKGTLLLLVGLVLLPNLLRAEIPGTLPLACSREKWRPLYDRVDPALQHGLETALRENEAWRALIDRGKLAVGLVDLSDPSQPRYARVNGRKMMYAASLPKIAILLAAFVSFEDGSLERSPEVMEDLNIMIRKSDNAAATRMIDRMGMQKIGSVLRDPRYRLYDKTRGGGLWVGKRFAKEGKRFPDPLTGLSHGATVLQVCRFYYLLAYGRIISPEASREMLEILSDPGLHHKFVGVLEERAPLARLFRKSGTWRIWHSDSVLVWDPVWRRYILAAMVECNEGEQILRDLVPVVEQILHGEESFAVTGQAVWPGSGR